jgi:hypothetical protein
MKQVSYLAADHRVALRNGGPASSATPAEVAVRCRVHHCAYHRVNTKSSTYKRFFRCTLMPRHDMLARAINDHNAVVGEGYIGPKGQAHPFLWSPTLGTRDLGLLYGADQAIAFGINNSNVVVGNSGCCDGGHDFYEAFYYSAKTGMTNLANLVDPADPLKSSIDNYLYIFDINDRGQIVGLTWLNGRSIEPRYIRLDPIAE